MPAAGFVDRQVAPVAHRVGLAALDRLVQEARVRFDPEEAEYRAAEATEARHATIHLHPDGQAGWTGTADLTATVDLPDAIDLEQVLQAGAAQLAADGSTQPLNVRRAQTLGLLARGQLTRHDTDHPTGHPTDRSPNQAATRRRPGGSCCTCTPPPRRSPPGWSGSRRPAGSC